MKRKTCLFLFLALMFWRPVIGRATTFDIPSGNVGALNSAINTANATPGPHTINLAPRGQYVLNSIAENDATWGASGTRYIRGQITINGNGATVTRNASAPGMRIFMVFTGNLTLNEIIITGGNGFDSGSGITMSDSTVLIKNSTIRQNRGGISNVCSNLTILNSTVSQNTNDSAYGGGGLLNFTNPGPSCAPKTYISFSTFFENRNNVWERGDSIADAFSAAGSIVVKNSIFASPTQHTANNCWAANGVIVSQGHNIGGDGTCPFTATGDLQNTNPNLNPTANNGGLTPTNNPTLASAAINGVPLSDCTDVFGNPVSTDQRQAARPQLAACDIGSLEAVPIFNFTKSVTPPVASPAGAVTFDNSRMKLSTAMMIIGGNGNPSQHVWLVKADPSGLMNITVQAGADNCCWDGSLLPGSGTIAGVVSKFGVPGTLANLSVTQPSLSPPAAYSSATLATNPSDIFVVNLTVPAGPQFSTYRLKVNGAEEAFSNGPAVNGGLASLGDGIRWVMNVNAGEPLNFSVLTGGPLFFFGSPNVVKGTQVVVYDPNNVQRLPLTTVDLPGSTISIPDAGNTPGAWTVVVVQPSHCQPGQECTVEDANLADFTLRPPYRILKGAMNSIKDNVVPGTAGIDPNVYTAWYTYGKGPFEAMFDAPAAITSVDVRLSGNMCTGYDSTGFTCSVVFTVPTNQLISDSEGSVGQVRAEILPPAGTIAIPAYLDIPQMNDGLTSIHVTIKDVTAPVLTLPANIIVPATSPAGATVSFTASANDQIEGSVAITCSPASGSTFPVGTTTVNCSASDSSGNTAQGSFLVTVKDTTPPVISSVTPNPASLWPPNHKMVNVALSVVVTDNSDPAVLNGCKIVSVTSNEAITSADYLITGNLTLQLRAERTGSKKDAVDRIYTITVSCTDAAGNSASKSTNVIVPHDQGK